MSKILFAASLVCGIAVFCAAETASAVLVTVPNGSFETAGGSFTTPADWQTEGDNWYSGDGTGTAALPAATDGAGIGSVAIRHLSVSSTTAGISSAASLGTYAANTVYTLTFDVGAEGGWWGVWQGDARVLSAGLGIYTGAASAATPVVIDTTDLQAPAATGGESYVELPGINVEGSHSYSGWKRFTVTLDTAVDASAVGQDISVILGWTHQDNFLREMAFDNVTLDAVTAAVPEPSSFLFLGSVSLLALFKNRRVRS